jgi:hypothetical protein
MKKSFWLPLFLCLLTIAIFVFIELTLPFPPAGAQLPDKIPEATVKSIDLLIALTSLFITFAMAALGGIAFFLKSALKAEFDLSCSEAALMICAAVNAVASIFAGHLVYTNTIEMLRNSFIAIESAAIVWPIRIQYLALFLSILLLFASALQTYMRKAQPLTVAVEPTDGAKEVSR